MLSPLASHVPPVVCKLHPWKHYQPCSERKGKQRPGGRGGGLRRYLGSPLHDSLLHFVLATLLGVGVREGRQVLITQMSKLRPGRWWLIQDQTANHWQSWDSKAGLLVVGGMCLLSAPWTGQDQGTWQIRAWGIRARGSWRSAGPVSCCRRSPSTASPPVASPALV